MKIKSADEWGFPVFMHIELMGGVGGSYTMDHHLFPSPWIPRVRVMRWWVAQGDQHSPWRIQIQICLPRILSKSLPSCKTGARGGCMVPLRLVSLHCWVMAVEIRMAKFGSYVVCSSLSRRRSQNVGVFHSQRGQKPRLRHLRRVVLRGKP